MWLGAHQAIKEIEIEIKLHWIYKRLLGGVADS
jgi:hypothetical protein